MSQITPPSNLQSPPALLPNGSIKMQSPPPLPNGDTPLHDNGVKDLSYLIISGGTGANSIAGAFGPSPAFVLPVSDDGGSSSEILRCFGGPSIGDIRSRLIRLIPLVNVPKSKDDMERLAIYNLMAYRFPAEAAEKVVRDLWMEIVEGRSELWDGIGEDKKECIRAFLVHFQTLCLRRAHKRFSFRNFSLGNGFLTGARDLFGSLPSAIFLFKSIAGVNNGVQVIPAINTNQTVTIAAQLANATTLIGQCTISHPTPPPTPFATTPSTPVIPATPIRPPQRTGAPSPLRSHRRKDSRTFDTPDTSAPGSRRHSFDAEDVADEGEGLAGGNLGYRKGEDETPLEAKIERIFYINLYGQEIYPEPNPDFLDTMTKKDVLVYSCGSLWTSIVPCLTLKGLGTALASSSSLKAKVLLLNSMNDRETPGYVAIDYINTIIAMLRHYDRPKRTRGKEGNANSLNPHLLHPTWRASDVVTHVVFLDEGKVIVDQDQIHAMGIKTICVPPEIHGAVGDETPLFSNEAVEWAMERVLQ